MGTSHNLGQNFSKPFNIKFLDRDEKERHVWQTSWGFSTRLIGALVMVHSDDKGLILPPKLAPVQIVIVPIFTSETKKQVMKEALKLKKELEKFSVELDDRKYTPGWKFNEWEMKGVPLRIEIGPKDIKKKQVILVRRDNGVKKAVKQSALEKEVLKQLDNIQKGLLAKAKKFLAKSTVDAKNFTCLRRAINQKKMVRIGWCGSQKCEDSMQDKTAATIRLIPFKEKPKGKCAVCGSKAKYVVYVAKQY
jgi:prolyl-tRNA synthetase